MLDVRTVVTDQLGKGYSKTDKVLTVYPSSSGADFLGPGNVCRDTRTLAEHTELGSSRRETGWNRTPRSAHLIVGTKTRRVWHLTGLWKTRRKTYLHLSRWRFALG